MFFDDGDFKRLFVFLVSVGALIGIGVTALVIFVAPYVWGIIKPWLHAITT